jgi:Zn-dependent protease
MPEFILNVGLELPLILILLALLGFRWKVNPRASVLVKATPDKVFALVDLHDGKVQNWNRTTVTSELIDVARRIFRMTYVTTLSTGTQQSSEAYFRVAERHEPAYLELRREGLEGKSHNNELLKIAIDTEAQADGTRLTLKYDWGPRPLIAQILARADLWGGAYRLKGLAETGKPDETTHVMISAGVAIVTGFLSLVAFALMLGWLISGLLVAALLVHEFGHLLAYRLIGQPWGRMIFLPFLGALAMPRLPYETQAQAVFAALMGPGFSVLLALAITLPLVLGIALPDWLIKSGIVVIGLNLFNLLPVEPLDGGVALRSVLAKLMGSYARFGLLAIGLLIVTAGLYYEQIILLIFGGISILANIKPRLIDHGLKPLSSLQVTISALGFMAIVTAYIAMLLHFLKLLVDHAA